MGDVQDERHVAVAENGCGRDAGDVPIALAETLDDDLPLLHDCIDNQGGPAAVFLRSQQHDTGLRLVADAAETKLSSEIKERHEFAADLHHFA